MTFPIPDINKQLHDLLRALNVRLVREDVKFLKEGYASRGAYPN